MATTVDGSTFFLSKRKNCSMNGNVIEFLAYSDIGSESFHDEKFEKMNFTKSNAIICICRDSVIEQQAALCYKRHNKQTHLEAAKVFVQAIMRLISVPLIPRHPSPVPGNCSKQSYGNTPSGLSLWPISWSTSAKRALKSIQPPTSIRRRTRPARCSPRSERSRRTRRT